MALSSITNRVAYIGDATSTVFPFAYDFFSPNDLSVYLWDMVAGVVYPQVLNTNYSVSGNRSFQGTYPSGGNVVMTSSIPTNLQLVITRSPAQIQNFVLNQNAPINSIGLTSQLDYLTLLVQRLQDEVSRSVGLADGMGFVNGSTFSPLLPSSICLTSSALQVVQVNSGATGFQLVALNASALAAGSSIIPVIQGGTGQSGALTPGAVWYSINTTTMANTGVGGVGQYLQSQGAGAPIWVTASSSGGGGATGSTSLTNQVSGILPIANGGTGVATLIPQYGIMYMSSATQASVIPSAASGQVLTANGSSAPSFQSVGNTLSISTKTAAYNAQTTDTVILVASGCSTINLYGASGNTGKQLYIKNTAAQFSTCTINGSGGALIDGLSSINLSTQYENYTLVCDGTNFDILSHNYPSTWASYAPSNTWTTNVTTTGLWRRVGDSIEGQGSISMSGSPGNASSAPVVGIPLGITINLTKVLVATPSVNSGVSLAGNGLINSFGQNAYQVASVISLASNSSIFIGGLITETTFTGTVYPFLTGPTNLVPFGPGSSTVIAFNFKVPITGWTQ